MQRIGRYEILQHLATGGMGKVFLARTSGLGGFERHVVIKTLELSEAEDHPYVSMFLDEARLVGGLHHQHIAPVYEVGRDDTKGRYYLVMEYVHGQTAQAVWEQTLDFGAALPIDFALTVASAAASALHYSHGRKMRDGKTLSLVHRDVTLSNLMIGYDGAVKLIDFGIAKAAGRRSETKAGYVKGKVGYMSPEQIAGKAIDHRADIFALGIVLYELTTMTRAFREPTDQATIDRIKKGEFVPPSQLVPGYPRGLELIIQKALRVDPAARFHDAETFRREVEALGHRQKLVLGDAAIIEVMTQLYDDRAEPWEAKRAETDLAVPIERSIDDRKTNPVPTIKNPVVGTRQSRPSVRNLRAATEVADQMVIEVHEEVEVRPTSRADDDKVTDPMPFSEDKTTVAKSPLATAVEGPEPKTVVAKPMRMTAARPAAVPATFVATPAAPPAAKLPDAPRTRSALAAWGIAALLVFAGITVFFVLIDRIDSSRAEADASPQPVKAAELPAPAKPIAQGPAKVSDPTPKPPEPPPKATGPKTVTIKITSTPSDATVLLDGQKLGHTPFEGSVPVMSGPHAIKLRRRGYTSIKLDVDLSADIKREITLQPDGGGSSGG